MIHRVSITIKNIGEGFSSAIERSLSHEFGPGFKTQLMAGDMVEFLVEGVNSATLEERLSVAILSAKGETGASGINLRIMNGRQAVRELDF